MLKLKDLMTHDVVTLHPDLSLRDAVQELAAEGISGAPVVAHGRLVGVISASDILDFQASHPGAPAFRTDQQEWGDWGPAQLSEADFSEPSSGYFRDIWADSGVELIEAVDHPGSPGWDQLSEHVVGEVMTRKVIVLGPDSSAKEAARIMMGSGIHRILVTEGDLLLGVVTTMDFVRAVSEGKIQ